VLIVSLFRGRTESLSVFFDIDVKGGEKVWSGCYSWRSKKNSAAFQGCHQCQRGRLLACFTGRVCLSLMERTTTTMENRKSISSGGEANNMQRSKLRRESAVQKCDQSKSLIVDLLRESSDHWITITEDQQPSDQIKVHKP
jgi:hypothetical protein